MTIPNVVFLFDVDNTLLDNDRVTADLKHHLEQTVGQERQENYWAIFEQLRTELGYADYLGALQRYRIEHAPRSASIDGLSISSELSICESSVPERARCGGACEAMGQGGHLVGWGCGVPTEKN